MDSEQQQTMTFLSSSALVEIGFNLIAPMRWMRGFIVITYDGTNWVQTDIRDYQNNEIKYLEEVK